MSITRVFSHLPKIGPIIVVLLVCSVAWAVGCSARESELLDTFDRTCEKTPDHICCSEPAQGTPCCLPETYEEPQCYFTLLCIADPTDVCCMDGAEKDPCCNADTALTAACICQGDDKPDACPQ